MVRISGWFFPVWIFTRIKMQLPLKIKFMLILFESYIIIPHHPLVYIWSPPSKPILFPILFVWCRPGYVRPYLMMYQVSSSAGFFSCFSQARQFVLILTMETVNHRLASPLLSVYKNIYSRGIKKRNIFWGKEFIPDFTILSFKENIYLQKINEYYIFKAPAQHW